jgi:ABC-2 type transport system permease protein
VKAIAAILYRDWRQRLTNVGFVFWDLLAPVAYLLLFGLGFERMIGGGLVFEGRVLSYTAFLLPGVIAMVGFTVALNAAWGFYMDKDSGIFHELLTYPITRPQLLVGKIGFNVLVALAGSALVVALAVGGLDVRVRWPWLGFVAAVIVVATAAWFFAFAVLAIELRRMDSFNTATSAAYLLLMFFSTMFYPVLDLPAWFRAIAHANPLTWQVDLLRFGLLGTGAPVKLALEAAALAAFAAAMLAVAVRALGRAD